MFGGGEGFGFGGEDGRGGGGVVGQGQDNLPMKKAFQAIGMKGFSEILVVIGGFEPPTSAL